MRTDMPVEIRLVSYADDVAALIAASNDETAQLRLDMVMKIVNGWMRDHGFPLALTNTEILVLTKKQIQTITPMGVGDLEIEIKPTAKYLGVETDSKMGFGEPIGRTANKAARGVGSLSKLMGNVGGPRSSRR